MPIWFSVIILQIVIFGVLIYALKKIMVGNTESAVNRLNESYQEVNRKKEELTKKIRQIEEECDKQRQAVQDEVKKIREESETELTKRKDQAISGARQKAEEIINNALGAKDQMRKDISKEERLKIINYCSRLVNNSLSDFIKEKISDIIIQEVLENIKGIDSKRIPSELSQVELVFSRELNSDLTLKVEEVISKKIGRKIDFIKKVDEKIVAGMVIKFGTLVIDQSLLAKIEQEALKMKIEVEQE